MRISASAEVTKERSGVNRFAIPARLISICCSFIVLFMNSVYEITYRQEFLAFIRDSLSSCFNFLTQSSNGSFLVKEKSGTVDI